MVWYNVAKHTKRDTQALNLPVLKKVVEIFTFVEFHTAGFAEITIYPCVYTFSEVVSK
jgi:hypothetical protein